MRKLYLSVILVIALLLSCFPLSGCGTVSREYRDFYESLVNSEGNFRFRETEPGDSQDAILRAEGIEGIIDEEITAMDSTGLFRCHQPVQFPCFPFDLYRDYRTPLLTSVKEGLRFDGFLTGGGYSAFFEEEAEFAAACRQVTAFLEEAFPGSGPFDALKQLPEREKKILSPQWQTEAKDGSQLSVTFQNKISPQTASYLPKFCSIQIEVSYRKLAEPFLPPKDDRPFYQALVNGEGNFRFRGTEPGDTFEKIAASYEAEGFGRDVLKHFSDSIHCTIPDVFPGFDFSLYKEYWMNNSVVLKDGKAESQAMDSLRSGSYDAYFRREEDWRTACRQVIDFLKVYFPEGESFEALEQLPPLEQVMSPQWSVKAPDGTTLSVTIQSKSIHDSPLAKSPSHYSINFSIMYNRQKNVLQ